MSSPERAKPTNLRAPVNGLPRRRVGVNFMPLFRPFRAGDICDHWTQGVALGYHIWPRWGLARSGW